MGARTILRAGTAVTAFALASVTLATAPAGGSTSGVVVRVDDVYARQVDYACVYDPLPSMNYECIGHYSGPGVTTDGLRQWTFTMTLREYGRYCYTSTSGTWTLVADDGSGDGLSGTVEEPGLYTTPMAVTAGTGAYGGASTEWYQDQQFTQAGVPPSLMPGGGCEKTVLVGDFVGSLEFHLQ